jgi:RNA polymerase sigma factor (sigma-70 family)
MLSITSTLPGLGLEQVEAVHVSVADAELIEGCLREKAQAQAALYKKYYGTLMSICVRYLGDRDHALEVLNNGFLKIFKSLKSYRQQGSFEGWMKRIVYHCVLDFIRQNANYKKKIVFESVEAGVEESTASKLYAADLLKLLDQVPIASRTVFNMFAIDGYKHEEIAESLGIAVGTSKWHLSEARKILKALIEKNN